MAFRGFSETPPGPARDAGSAVAPQSQPSWLRNGRQWRQCVLAAVVALWLAGVASATETVTYILRPMPQAGRLEVELSWKTKGRERSALGVSKRWGAIDNVPRLLSNVRFEGASARRDGPRWLLKHRRGATVNCWYEVDPRRRAFDWRNTHTPITTPTFFHGMGNAFLLVPRPAQGESDEYEVILRWQLPDGWKAACSWAGTGRSVGARIKADDLRHSVYLAGELVTRTVQDEGRTVTVAMVDAFDFSADGFARMASTIIRHECEFMDEKQFPPFVVTAIPVGQALRKGESRLSGAGLYDSFALFVAPKSTLNDAVEHLFAHELFHFWNGRMLAAAEPERLLYWFVEGFTDYYALRILYESGQWDAERYAKWINRHIREYHRNPAIHAPNEDIAARFWTERDTVGEVAYQRGLLLGLRWHRLARDQGVSDGLDRLFKALVERARQGAFELTNEAIRTNGVSRLGPWFGPEFDRFVVKAETVPVPEDALRPHLVGQIQPTYEYELGFDRDESLAVKRVSGLVPGSAAAKAGLREGDVLASYHIYGDPNKKIELHIRRGKLTKTIRYYPRAARQDVLQFRPAGEGTGSTP